MGSVLLEWQPLQEAAMKKYRVTLTDDERRGLHDLIAAGKAAAKRLAHARILLKADAAPGGPAWTDDQIAEAVEVSVATVERVRRRVVEHGLEARLVALACSPPPDGRKEWTMQLLADKLVELEIVGSISDETVRRTLQKTRS